MFYVSLHFAIMAINGTIFVNLDRASLFYSLNDSMYSLHGPHAAINSKKKKIFQIIGFKGLAQVRAVEFCP